MERSDGFLVSWSWQRLCRLSVGAAVTATIVSSPRCRLQFHNARRLQAGALGPFISVGARAPPPHWWRVCAGWGAGQGWGGVRRGGVGEILYQSLLCSTWPATGDEAEWGGDGRWGPVEFGCRRRHTHRHRHTDELSNEKPMRHTFYIAWLRLHLFSPQRSVGVGEGRGRQTRLVLMASCAKLSSPPSHGFIHKNRVQRPGRRDADSPFTVSEQRRGWRWRWGKKDVLFQKKETSFYLHWEKVPFRRRWDSAHHTHTHSLMWKGCVERVRNPRAPLWRFLSGGVL